MTIYLLAHRVLGLLFLVFIYALICTYFVGCSSTIEQHGYYINHLELSKKLRPGIDTKETVLEILGPPTLSSTFNQSVWYYMTQTNKTSQVLSPCLIKMNSLKVQFDQNNMLISAQILTHNTKTIEYDNETTDSKGYNRGVLRDVFGNIGRYSLKS